MIQHEFREDDGIMIIEPQVSLQENDFDMLSTIIEPCIHNNGKLNDLVRNAG